MPNKTIYVRNEELWKKAKAIAGKEGDGLSGVIAEALAEFVRKHEAAAEGHVVHRFTVEHDEETLERVAFAGREIGSRSFPAVSEPATLIATVYVTRGGKFVLALAEEGGETAYHFATYSRPREIASDEDLLQLGDEDDIREWVASIWRRHFEETSNEIWIE